MVNHLNGEHEIKYVVGNSRAHHVIDWLRRNCLSDPDYSSGFVCSIYYDTRSWRFLNEKMNSDFFKTKIRVRWYENFERNSRSPNGYIEAKYKYGGKRRKIRIAVPYSGEWLAGIRLVDPRLLALPFLLGSEGVHLSGHYFPVYKISYRRFRFIDPVTRYRVCFDSDITAPEVNPMMMSKQFPFRVQTAVLEVKGDKDGLPLSLRPLLDMGFRKSSFSKYEACYRTLTGSFC